MGANAIQAAAELYMGLVEVGVGLIPGGGGNLHAAAQPLRAVRHRPRLRPAALPEEGCSSPSARRRCPPRAEEAREIGLPRPRRRHRLEPRLPAQRRQGARAGHGGRGLPAAAAPRTSGCPGRSGAATVGHDAVRHAGQPPDLRARPADRPEAGPRAHRRRRLGAQPRSPSSTCSTSSARRSSRSAARRRPRTASRTCWRRASRSGTRAIRRSTTMASRVVIASAVRTPFTRALKGELKDTRPDTLAADAIRRRRRRRARAEARRHRRRGARLRHARGRAGA